MRGCTKIGITKYTSAEPFNSWIIQTFLWNHDKKSHGRLRELAITRNWHFNESQPPEHFTVTIQSVFEIASMWQLTYHSVPMVSRILPEESADELLAIEFWWYASEWCSFSIWESRETLQILEQFKQFKEIQQISFFYKELHRHLNSEHEFFKHTYYTTGYSTAAWNYPTFMHIWTILADT